MIELTSNAAGENISFDRTIEELRDILKERASLDNAISTIFAEYGQEI